MASDRLSIAEVIGEIRTQLEQAQAEGAESSLKFEVGPVELTFTVEAEKTTGVDGGVRVWVLSAGAKHDATRSATQTVTVTLAPYILASDGSHVPIDVARARRGRPDGMSGEAR